MLSGIGTVSYGTGAGAVTFSGYITSKVTATPRWDDAGVTIVGVDWVLAIRAPINTGIVNGGSGNDGAIDGLLSQWETTLLTPGLQLKYAGVGLGKKFQVIPGSTPADVDWGPKPRRFSFEARGGGSSVGMVGAIVNWEVGFCIPVCQGTPKYSGAIMALNYTTDWAIDQQGLTTRNITGYVEIPLSRKPNSRAFPDTADSYRSKVVPQKLYGFQRTQRFTLSANKKRLNFVFTDRQLPAVWPNGACEFSGEHAIESSVREGFNIWSGTISANIGMVPDSKTRKADAWDRFMLIVRQRIGTAKDKLPAMVKDPKTGELTASVLLYGLSIRENLSGLNTSFSMRYTISGVGLKEILKTSGLWEPIKGFDKNTWTDSMTEAFNERGIAQLKAVASESTIVDLCATAQPIAIAQKPKENAGAGARGKKATPQPNQVQNVNAGWIGFNNKLEVKEADRVIRHKPLNGAPATTSTLWPNWLQTIARNLKAVPDAAPGAPKPSADAKVPDLLQRVSTPTITLRMPGDAAKLVDRVPVPYLRQVAGVPVTLQRQHFSERSVGGVDGAAVNYLEWDQEYIMPWPPGQPLPLLANPATGVNGSDGLVTL